MISCPQSRACRTPADSNQLKSLAPVDFTHGAPAPKDAQIATPIVQSGYNMQLNMKEWINARCLFSAH